MENPFFPQKIENNRKIYKDWNVLNCMTFFSKNKQTAIKRVRKLAKTDKRYKGKNPVLAEKQISHSSRWKTWKLKPRK